MAPAVPHIGLLQDGFSGNSFSSVSTLVRYRISAHGLLILTSGRLRISPRYSNRSGPTLHRDCWTTSTKAGSPAWTSTICHPLGRSGISVRMKRSPPTRPSSKSPTNSWTCSTGNAAGRLLLSDLPVQAVQHFCDTQAGGSSRRDGPSSRLRQIR